VICYAAIFSEKRLLSVSDSTTSPSDSSDTLYDPPEAPMAPDAESSEEEDTVALRLPLPKSRSDRLRAVAQQLGLTPSLAAKRAIELVCDEVVTTPGDTRSTHLLIDQYQARLDLLHSVEQSDANGTLELPTDG